MNTRTRIETTRLVLALALGAVSWGVGTSARADDTAASEPTEESAQTSVKKQWVWLSKQSCWGYGYQREDGLWVIDPGTKRNAQPADEASWFVNWLNRQRASMGLSAVGHDPNLTRWAAANNAQQQARGMGHFVM